MKSLKLAAVIAVAAVLAACSQKADTGKAARGLLRERGLFPLEVASVSQGGSTGRSVRRTRLVRWARLAGTAPLPRTVEIDDEPAELLRQLDRAGG